MGSLEWKEGMGSGVKGLPQDNAAYSLNDTHRTMVEFFWKMAIGNNT